MNRWSQIPDYNTWKDAKACPCHGRKLDHCPEFLEFAESFLKTGMSGERAAEYAKARMWEKHRG